MIANKILQTFSEIIGKNYACMGFRQSGLDLDGGS